ncbi:hypothetical protein AB1E18_010851 [Capra hircus]
MDPPASAFLGPSVREEDVPNGCADPRLPLAPEDVRAPRTGGASLIFVASLLLYLGSLVGRGAIGLTVWRAPSLHTPIEDGVGPGRAPGLLRLPLPPHGGSPAVRLLTYLRPSASSSPGEGRAGSEVYAFFSPLLNPWI